MRNMNVMDSNEIVIGSREMYRTCSCVNSFLFLVLMLNLAVSVHVIVVAPQAHLNEKIIEIICSRWIVCGTVHCARTGIPTNQ